MDMTAKINQWQDIDWNTNEKLLIFFIYVEWYEIVLFFGF